MSTFLIFALLGVASGSLYALGALGIVVVYRGTGVINFASGALGLVGTFVFWNVTSEHRWPLALALIVGVGISAVLGFVVSLLMRLLGRASNLTKVVMTLAILLVIQGSLNLIYPNSGIYLFNSILPTGPVSFHGITMGQDRLYLIAISVILTAVVYVVYRYTRFGIATSAVAENPGAIAALGWSSDMVAAVNWAVGGALAGLAGILLAPITGLSGDLATELLLPCLAAAVIGNLSSFPLTFLGGILIGLTQSELGEYSHVSGLGDAVPFAAIIIIVVWRGQNLPLRNFVAERLPVVSTGRLRLRAVLPIFAVAIILMYTLPQIWVAALTFSIIGAVVVLSVVVITGYAGQISLAQVATAGCAALVMAQARSHGIPFWWAIIIGLGSAIPIGVLVGGASLRARGMSLAVATLAFGQCMVSLFLNNESLTGGSAGLNIGNFELFGINMSFATHPRAFGMFCLVVAAVIGVMVSNIRRGASGRQLLAVRSNERSAAALGINIFAAKLVAFCYASLVAAAGGILGIIMYPVALFTTFDVLSSVQLVSNGVLGSVGYVSGAGVAGLGSNGGVVNQAIATFANGAEQYLPIILGTMTILVILQSPDGLVVLNIRQFRTVVSKITRRTPRAKRIRLPAVTGTVDSVAPVELKVEGLSVTLGGVRVLNDVSFDLRSGEVLGVIGPNGAGKTTLIDAITGFAPVATGQLFLDGRTLTGSQVYKRSRRGIARSFQSVELFEDLSVYENIAAANDGKRWSPWLIDVVRPKSANLGLVGVSAVKELGLEEVLHEYPSALSYGHRRLVGIARVLAGGARVVLLDEPAAGLDNSERQHLCHLIRRLAEEWQLAILLVEHDVALVAQVSDRMLALEFGNVVAEGDPDAVRSDPAVQRSYLGIEKDLDHAIPVGMSLEDSASPAEELIR